MARACTSGQGTICHEDPSEQLYKAFQGKDLKKFKELLQNTSNFIEENSGGEIKYSQLKYNENEWRGTLLHYACHLGESEFLEPLLKYYETTNQASIPNLFDQFYRRAPIHAVMESKSITDDAIRTKTLQTLLTYHNIDVNKSDGRGDTILHSAVRSSNIEYVKLLLDQVFIDVNKQNSAGKTALHIALLKEREDKDLINDKIIEMLLTTNQQSHIDVDLEDENKLTVRDLLKEYGNPKLCNLLPTENMKKIEDKKTFHHMKQLLEDNKDEEFMQVLASGKYENLNQQVGGYTHVHHCAEYGKEQVLQQLLGKGANPNGPDLQNNVNYIQHETPIMIALYKGYDGIVNILIEHEDIKLTPVNYLNVFHKVIEGSKHNYYLGETNTPKNYDACLKILLENDKCKPYINLGDHLGNAPLHYAAKYNKREVIEKLLKAGAYIGSRNNAGKPVFALIPLELLEAHLDCCISDNDLSPQEEDYEINLSYNFLVLPNFCIIDDDIEAQLQLTTKSSLFNYETQPLVQMSKMTELSQLLKHPVITSFLYIKWNKIRHIYYCNLIFYILFCLLFTWNILNVYGGLGPRKVNPFNENLTNNSQEDTKENIIQEHFFQDHNLQNVVWMGTVVFSIILFFRELFQCIILLDLYKTKENLLEIGVIVISILILFAPLNKNVGHQIAAFGILFAWGEMVLLIGRHPNLATYIEMLKTVTKSFFKFLLWYSSLLIAFALSFYTLFNDNLDANTFFDHPFISMFKVAVMLTGEFDAASVPFDKYPASSYILFVLFVFLIAIVLLNLLNGLAISDTQRIKSDAELVVYKSQIDMISNIEMVLNNSNLWEKAASQIKSLLCCFINISTDYNYLKNKWYTRFGCSVDIFPELSKIIILPNKENIVETETRKLVDKKGWFCCLSKECTTLKMNEKIVKSAKAIINIKKKGSETINLELRIKNIEEKMKTMLNILKNGLSNSNDKNNNDDD